MTISEPETKEVLRLAARKHFWAFCNYMDFDFFQRRKFLKESAIHIQRLIEGEILRLSISFPPRAGKSYLASMAAAYTIGTKPTQSVMRNSCTATLYNKFSYDVRDIVKSEKFNQVFPEVELSNDKQSVTGWNVKQAKQVTYFGNGVGGTIIGFGASALAITDDLYKSHEDALSETINDKTHSWFQSAHSSRLEKHCPELDIGTRWHKKDVIGTRIERGDYDVSISVPALIDGETFCEDVKTTEEYEEIKSVTDEFIWDSEYMQNPIDAKGLVFPSSELTYYETKNDNKGVRIGFIDTADEGEDYLSFPVVEFFHESQTGYLIDVTFNQDNLTINEPYIIAKTKDLKIDYLVIETNKEGTYFVNTIRRQVACKVFGQFNSTNKVTRIIGQSGYIKKMIRFKKVHDKHYEKFMQQLTTYLKTGKSKHDDAPDSLSGLMAFIRKIFVI